MMFLGSRPDSRTAWSAPFLVWGLVACHHSQPAEPPRPEGLLLIADSGHGRVLFSDHAADKRVGELCLAELFPDDCVSANTEEEDDVCLVFGIDREPDSEALRVVRAGSTLEQVGFPGGVMALDPGHPPGVLWSVDRLAYPDAPDLDAACDMDPDEAWGGAHDPSKNPLCQLNMPHMSQWMPDGQTLVVTDTLNNRVVWVRPLDGGDRTDVVGILAYDHSDLDDAWWPNAVQVIEDDGRVLLLLTFKGSDPSVVGSNNLGRIQLWDVTALDDPIHLWSWPEDGYLAAVHGGRVVSGPDGDTLLYGHAYGASDDAEEGLHGSVGVARVDLPDPPEYIADVLLAGDRLGFVRQADWLVDDDGAWELLVTDSGCEHPYADCGLPARVSELLWEGQSASGLGGAWSADHEDQLFVELTEARQGYIGGLEFPFESRLYGVDEVPQSWWELGGCE